METISPEVINRVMKMTDTGARFIGIGNGLFKQVRPSNPTLAFDSRRGVAGDEGQDDPGAAELLDFLKQNLSPIASDAFLKKMGDAGYAFSKIARTETLWKRTQR